MAERSRWKGWNGSRQTARARTARGIAALSLLPTLTGCRRAPSYSILGSFFPVWLFCVAAGVLLAFLVHLLLVRLELQQQLAPPLLVYPAMAAFFSLALWLVFYS